MQIKEPERVGWRPHSTQFFVQAEHGLYVALALLLCATSVLVLAGAAVTLWMGLGDWTATNTVFVVLDRLLVVLIASIRRILVITLETSQTTQQGKMSDGAEQVFRTSMIELGVLAMLILVMVASIYLLRRADPGSTDDDASADKAIKT